MTLREVSQDPVPQMEGSDFVARVRAGDRETLEAVIHAYLGQILRAARGAGLSPERAEDVTQATFATFIEVARRFEGRSHVRTFLFGILYKKIAEARRGERREQQTDSIEDLVESRFALTEAGSAPRGLSIGSCKTRRFETRSMNVSTSSRRSREWPSSCASWRV